MANLSNWHATEHWRNSTEERTIWLVGNARYFGGKRISYSKLRSDGFVRVARFDRFIPSEEPTNDR